MCTVTYLPKGKDAFILTSNRDESPLRSAVEPQIDQVGAYQVLYPKDPLAGGTWICTAEDNRLICLLNGAFVKHERTPPYRRSRGLIVLDFFRYENAEEFLVQCDLDNIEPFTLVIYDNQQLIELKWDGNQKHIRRLDNQQPHIWSSATLYPANIAQKRSSWFDEWLQKTAATDFTANNITHFHRTGGDGDSFNDLVMNRFGIVKTVSISCVEKKANRIIMTHHDLLHDKTTQQQLAIKKTRQLVEKA